MTNDGETVISDFGNILGKRGAERSAVLIVLKGEEVGRRYILNETQLLVGRDPQRADIVIADRAVSQVHSRIEVDSATHDFIISDLQSRNGMLVNASKTDRAILKEGDCIFIGCTVLKFVFLDELESDFHREIDVRMNIDELTGLPVKRVFDIAYRKEFERARRSDAPIAVLMMDMDGLKKINDTHGHQAGAFCISEVGRRIGAIIGAHGMVSRFGGDEFIACLPDHGIEDACAIAERIRADVAGHTFAAEGFSVNPTISIGAAPRDTSTLTPEELVRRADDALYRAKRGGRNCVSI